MIAIGNPFILNMTSKMSCVWFPKEWRLLATSISFIMTIFGITVGFLLAITIVHNPVPPDDWEIRKKEQSQIIIKSQIQIMLLIVAVIHTIVLIVAVFIFKDNVAPRDHSLYHGSANLDSDPMIGNSESKTLPSIVLDQELHIRNNRVNATSLIKWMVFKLLRQPSFVCLCMATSLVIGTTLVTPIVIRQNVVAGHNDDQREGDRALVLYLSFGISGVIVSTLLNLNNQYYKRTCILLTVLGLGCAAVGQLGMINDWGPKVGLGSSVFFSFVTFGQLPLAFEWAS